ncbi:MAG: hypothetical protein LBG86_00650, partial [Puniceicoccales bacterium]|nr:hypothetical protein [Puniceicoccales bacterium]
MCECRSQFSDRHGFALLLTLGFLAIMGAILLTVDQYARIQSERGQREMHRAIARQNALGALKIAIGELNAIHGDGRHITARAELRREMVQPEHSQWVGVWDVVDGVAIFNRWLLSIPIPQKWDIQSPLTVFPEEIDIWKDFCPKDRCPTLPIYNGERLTGHFAYWIEDECSKARINLENPSIPLRHIVQQIPFHGLENSSKRLAGQRPFAALWDAMNGDAGAYFHGISLSSCGILRNTCGQWLIDLTTKLRHRQFSPHDYIFPADPQWAEPPPTFSFVASFFDATSHGQDTTIAPQSGGPHYLFHGFATNVYSHGMAQLPVADLGLNISTVASIHPIIVGMCISLIAEGNNQAVT